MHEEAWWHVRMSLCCKLAEEAMVYWLRVACADVLLPRAGRLCGCAGRLTRLRRHWISPPAWASSSSQQTQCRYEISCNHYAGRRNHCPGCCIAAAPAAAQMVACIVQRQPASPPGAELSLPLQVLLTEEADGSLRKLKATPANLLERYKSLQKRGIVEPRKPVRLRHRRQGKLLS